jgi:hypothetical protein
MSFLHVFARPIFFEPYPNGWKESSKQTFRREICGSWGALAFTKVRADKQSLEVKSDGISQQVQETFVMLRFLVSSWVFFFAA